MLVFNMLIFLSLLDNKREEAITWVMASCWRIERKNQFMDYSRIDEYDSSRGMPYAKSYRSCSFFRRLLSAGWEIPSMRAATV